VSAPYTKVGPSVLGILYYSDSIEPAPSGYFANNAQVSDSELDELLDQAEQTTDNTERADLYDQARQKILENYYVLRLYNQQNIFLYAFDVKGMGDTSAIAAPDYYNVWLDQSLMQLLGWLGRRVGAAAILLWLVATAIVIAIRLIPGDTADAIMGGPGSHAS